MDKIYCSAFVFSVLVTICSGTILHLSETEYGRMPPLVHLEPYERCVRQPGALYCDVVFTLVTDAPSLLLTMIQNYSAFVSKHFNHTTLHYGICVTETCKDFLEETNVNLKWTLEACLNKTMWERYELKSKVSDEYNCNIHEKELHRGMADTIVAAVCIVILMANIAASLFDHYCPGKLTNKGIKFLLCFSIMRNLRKLTATLSDDADPRLKQLQSIHGFRAITTCLVIMVHSFLPSYLFAQNLQYIEALYDEVYAQILLNGTAVMQTFLIMSGFLLVYNCLLHEEKKEISWLVLPKYIALRILRLTPPYALVLGLTATWLRYVSKGPFRQTVVGSEAEDCRQHWWRHLLYINNYYDGSRCMPQTWYLSTDMQLFVFGVVMYVLCKSPRVRRLLLPTAFVIGVLMPGLHTYFQDLDANMLVTPETVLAFFTNNRVFDNIYKRGHTSLTGYVIGLSLGYLVYHWQKIGVIGQKYHKYRFVYRALWLLATGLVYSGSVFYENRPRDPMYVRVLYSVVVKLIFALLIAATMAGTMLGVESFYRGILEWQFWTCVSRLSYSAYLWHVAYIRTTAASVTSTMPITFIVLLYNCTTTVVATFLIALVFWVLVEAPLGNLLKKARAGPTVEPAADTKKVNGHSFGSNGRSMTKPKDE